MDDHQFNNILPPYGFMDLLKIVASTQLVHAHLIKVTTNDNFNSMVFYSQGVINNIEDTVHSVSA